MPSRSVQFDRDTLAKVGRLTLRARRVVEGLRAGTHRSPLQGASVEFAEHKEYTPGDDLRHIDWKLLGRLDKYYIKRFEEETNLVAYLVLDTSASMGFRGLDGPRAPWWTRMGRRFRSAGPGMAGTVDGSDRDRNEGRGESKHDHAVLLAAALAYLLMGQGDAVGVSTFGGGDSRFVPPRAHRSHLNVVMEVLSSIHPAGRGGIAEALAEFAPRVTRRSLVVLISDLLEEPEAILETMKTLRTRRNDVVVFHLLHPDELTFPYDDVSRFVDPEESDGGLVVDPREIREGYLQELDGFLSTIRQRLLESRVDYNLIDTGRPVADALATFLAGRLREGGRR